jgi:hypothetical protein
MFTIHHQHLLPSGASSVEYVSLFISEARRPVKYDNLLKEVYATPVSFSICQATWLPLRRRWSWWRVHRLYTDLSLPPLSLFQLFRTSCFKTDATTTNTCRSPAFFFLALPLTFLCLCLCRSNSVCFMLCVCSCICPDLCVCTRVCVCDSFSLSLSLSLSLCVCALACMCVVGACALAYEGMFVCAWMLVCV